MPCGPKWKNKTMRRFPLTLRGGIGSSHPRAYGLRSRAFQLETDRYVHFQPGAQPIVSPHLAYSHIASLRGRYTPYTLEGAIPARCAGCPNCMPDGIGGGGGCAGGSDPRWGGGNMQLQGASPSSYPVGMAWNYQHHHKRWPPQQRRAPYPILQQPYWVGKSPNYYSEPFAGTPTRAAPYYINAESNCAPPAGVHYGHDRMGVGALPMMALGVAHAAIHAAVARAAAKSQATSHSARGRRGAPGRRRARPGQYRSNCGDVGKACTTLTGKSGTVKAVGLGTCVCLAESPHI